jgi:hypothetical protein
LPFAALLKALSFFSKWKKGGKASKQKFTQESMGKKSGGAKK